MASKMRVSGLEKDRNKEPTGINIQICKLTGYNVT